jgi:hypothetical protein
LRELFDRFAQAHGRIASTANRLRGDKLATIWFLKEGELHAGPSIERKSLDWCFENLGLRPDNWIADLPPKNLTIGGKSEAGLGPYRGFRFVIVEINLDELGTSSTSKNWKAGFHLLDMDATEAIVTRRAAVSC